MKMTVLPSFRLNRVGAAAKQPMVRQCSPDEIASVAIFLGTPVRLAAVQCLPSQHLVSEIFLTCGWGCRGHLS
jgi:hypothetical protein